MKLNLLEGTNFWLMNSGFEIKYPAARYSIYEFYKALKNEGVDVLEVWDKRYVQLRWNKVIYLNGKITKWTGK